MPLTNIKLCRHTIYTSLFNLIDYPGMVIPLHSAVDAELDPIDRDFKPANPRDAEIQATCESFLPCT